MHTKWRDMTLPVNTNPETTTKHFERSLQPANATYIRRQHGSSKKLDGRPILNSYESTYPNFSYFFVKLTLSVVDLEPKYLTVVVDSLLQVYCPIID